MTREAAVLVFTVALIGPDGVGKTTIARALERSFPRPVRYLYMGDNIESCNYALPTTRWWKRRQPPAASAAAPAAPRTGALRAARRSARKTIGFANRILEETYRQMVARWLGWRGYIVVFDRHFVWDYYHVDIAPQAAASFKRRLHGRLMRRIHREPDLVVCLDAPGEVVFRRKGEFSPEHLEARRAQYLNLRGVARHFAVVDADRPLEAVVGDVSRIIEDFCRNGRHAGA